MSNIATSILDGTIKDDTTISIKASLSRRDASTAVKTARSSVVTNAVNDGVSPGPHQPSNAFIFGAIGAGVGLLCVGVAVCVAVLKRRSNSGKSDKASSVELQSGGNGAAPSTPSTEQQLSDVDQYQSVSAASGRAPVEYGQRPVGKRDDHYEDLSAVVFHVPGQSADTDIDGSQRRQIGAGIPSNEELHKRGYSAVSAIQRKQYGQRPIGKNDDHYVVVAEL